MATRTSHRRRRWHPPEDLRALDRAYVMCRTVGHAWDDFIPMRKPAKFGDRLSLRCLRCATERHDIVSWVDGSLLQREYQHPEGYAMAERHSRSEFRATLMVIRREAAKQAMSAAGVDENGVVIDVDVTDGSHRSRPHARARARAGAGAGAR